ncbi:hypothetical protein [Nocardia jiangxiensis]|uniref:Major facilitator superfamily (MFS) profile domain-containing protein n=1 Tax=Nocardia jiangxiensis TaxID=282685 RepID=A0ABW6S758_9NOCA|nr:hypothetical protein [Nocardia jiangxiensis]
MATTAFNVGAVLGPFAAGPLVDRTDRPATALWCSAAFTAAAVGVVLVGHRRRATSEAGQVRAETR